MYFIIDENENSAVEVFKENIERKLDEIILEEFVEEFTKKYKFCKTLEEKIKEAKNLFVYVVKTV